MESLRSVFFIIDRSAKKLTTGRIHYFDIRYSLFDIRYSLFQSFFSLIRLAVFSGQRPQSCETRSFKSEPQNIEQEISNDEGWNRFALSF
ncbi:hypothetical protein D1AOALGA4SA_13057 [Olavius algarvensis Delta 1 endosymbiont]|nr:hypothetical protein D1AOALGA4SA_13057 [Olavius algarvensis Delta 1 endosymbiont]